jgi:hypothetical protein
MKLTFCAASGATSDIQHHHLVTSSEGRKRFDDERISAVLADEGHFTSKGKPYSPTQITRILTRDVTEISGPE